MTGNRGYGFRVLVRSAAVIAASAASFGCTTAALSRSGAHVATSESAPVDQGYPPASCKNLGYVVGTGGGSFGGAWISNQDLVKFAMNDLRNKVAELGGNFVQHEPPQMGIAGDHSGTATTTATVSGTAYQCDDSAKVRPASPAPEVSSSPPEGAGGFKFGAAVGESQSACVAAGHSWTRTGDDAECSDTLVPVASVARVVLHLCSDATCGVDLVVQQPAPQLVAKYDDLYSALEKKYGTPRQPRVAVDAACSKDLVQCLAGAAAPKSGAWRWHDGNLIEIGLALSSGAPVLRVAYSAPTRTKKLAPGPAL